MVTIRTATPDDARGIASVKVETWRSAYRGILADEILDSLSVETHTCGWLEIMRQSNQITFVAEVEGHGVVGFANGGLERTGREDFRGEVWALYILPQSHGQGIGRALVTTFAHWLTDSGFATMLVWVLADNPFRRF